MRPKGAISLLLRIISEASNHQWLVLRSTDLNTFDMTNPIYSDPLCPAVGGIG